MKLSVQDIGSEGLDLAFDKDRSEVDAMMEITKGDFHGSDEGMQVRLRAEKVQIQDAVLIRGHVTAGLIFGCGRCLEQRKRVLTTAVDAVLFPLHEVKKFESDVELSADDMDVSFYEDDEIDLTDIVREALLLEMPTYPTCNDEEECNPLKTKQVEDEGSGIDPRWEALLDIKSRMADKKN